MPQFNIEITSTSNPHILKFSANTFLTQASSYEFNNIDEAGPSPLAQQLFYLPFVKTVYISQNFVAIEKFNIVEWIDVQKAVAESIEEYLNSGKPAIVETPKKMPVSIYAETTPNPSVMKFIANKTLVTGILEFKKSEEAIHSPLAKGLFNFPFVKEVFFSNNYASITKQGNVDWQEISMELREFIRQYVQDGKDVISDQVLDVSEHQETSTEATSTKNAIKERTAIENEIISILDEYVKPAVADDGGNIQFDSYNPETKTVKVILQGACSGCPSSTVTLKNGIEGILKQMLEGQINEVVAINE